MSDTTSQLNNDREERTFPCPTCDYEWDYPEDAESCCVFTCEVCYTDYTDEMECSDCCCCDWCGNKKDVWGCSRCYECGNMSCQCSCCPDCGYHPCQCDERYMGCGCPLCNPDGTNGQPTSVTAVATKYGMRPDRPLCQHIADFYLLEYLWKSEKVATAYLLLTNLADELAPELATYLDLACGGEIRHAYTDNPSITDARLKDNPVRNKGSGRGMAWEIWAEWKNPLERMRYATDVFTYGCAPVTEEDEKNGYVGAGQTLKRTEETAKMWSGGGYGGPAWGSISKTMEMYLDGTIKDNVAFLDRVWNLQHNGGCALNKVYREAQGATITIVLNAHANDDRDKLLEHASQEVKDIYELNESKNLPDMKDTKGQMNWESLLLQHHLKKNEPLYKEVKSVKSGMKLDAKYNFMLANPYIPENTKERLRFQKEVKQAVLDRNPTKLGMLARSEYAERRKLSRGLHYLAHQIKSGAAKSDMAHQCYMDRADRVAALVEQDREILPIEIKLATVDGD